MLWGHHGPLQPERNGEGTGPVRRQQKQKMSYRSVGRGPTGGSDDSRVPTAPTPH